MATISDIPQWKLDKLRLLITDVDGVLTTGGIGYTASGDEFKIFDVKDGAGFKYWQRGGGLSAFLTGRSSEVVLRRAEELGVDKVIMNAKDKLPEFTKIISELGVSAEEVIYIGDDWPDIPCIREAGVGVAVSDATPETIEVADAVTCLPGGKGAVREVIVDVLRAQGKIDQLMERYK